MKISLDLENCYGIQSLLYEFDFTSCNTFLIYAPNGAMKTSLAKVFDDLSKSKTPSDKIFQNRTSKCVITDDTGIPLKPSQIFVAFNYDEEYKSERISTLLVDKTLRNEYELIYKTINESKDTLLSAIGNISGQKRNIEDHFLEAFNRKNKECSLLLIEIQSELISLDNTFANIQYNEVVNDKIESFLKSPNVQALLSDYLNKYNEIIGNSSYFRKGGFNPYNANTVSKNLNDNKFFSAEHSILLSDTAHNQTEITSQKDLNKIITEETERILNDDELKSKFQNIDRQLMQNAELRNFHQYLLNNMIILPELANYDLFKKKLWYSYLNVNKDLYNQFIAVFNTQKLKIESIIDTAKNQETIWKKAVDVFKRRFSVPFIIDVENKADVILKNEAPSIVFKYNDGIDECFIGKDQLLNVLSTGEQRALYLLNIIFEILSREQEITPTILILDDIADSFDYRNKFAIIEYITDIKETNKFYILSLTHNFDFFRTLKMRLNIHNTCLTTIKNTTGIKFSDGSSLDVPFKRWKQQLSNDRNCVIAMIPFIRNIIEYSHGTNNREYDILTSLLHYRIDTDNYSINDLITIFNGILQPNPPIGADTAKVIDIIFQQADICYNDSNESCDLEKKIVLSIAIRLKAEKAMILKINDPTKLNPTIKNQTRELFKIYKQMFSDDNHSENLLSRVLMMTPEAIHLNSFMYEPIIDLSDHHLKSLYQDITQYLNRLLP